MSGSALVAAYIVGCGDGGQPQPTTTATPPAKPSPTSARSALSWRRLQAAAGSPPPRRDHSLVSDGQRLFLFGGRDKEALADLWSYD
ncbi:MAG: Kelch repeat-containing protein, partial [Dehalococcoidia bacterium]